MRRLLRVPNVLYALHLGWIGGHQFLRLTHRGRSSGKTYHTVLEVIRYDAATRESVVSVGFVGANWFKNIQASPALRIATGRESYVPTFRVLDIEEREAVLSAWVQRHPLERRAMARLFGVHFDGSGEGVRQVAATLPMVAFRPAETADADSQRNETHAPNANPGR